MFLVYSLYCVYLVIIYSFCGNVYFLPTSSKWNILNIKTNRINISRINVTRSTYHKQNKRIIRTIKRSKLLLQFDYFFFSPLLRKILLSTLKKMRIENCNDVFFSVVLICISLQFVFFYRIFFCLVCWKFVALFIVRSSHFQLFFISCSLTAFLLCHYWIQAFYFKRKGY